MDHRNPSGDEPNAGLIPKSDAQTSANSSLSGWSQFKLIMGKNRTLKWRSGADFCCETLAPLILIFAISCLSLAGKAESHEASPFFTSTIRDTSVFAFLQDRIDDPNEVYKDQNNDRAVTNRVGQVLFASDDSSVPAHVLRDLCNKIVTKLKIGVPHWNSVHGTGDPGRQVQLDPLYHETNCCEMGQLIRNSSVDLDAQAVKLADKGSYFPILGGVVINSYSTADGLDYGMRFNRSYIDKTSFETDPFTSYPSSFWLQYTSSGFVLIQNLVESYFIGDMTNKTALELEPIFQSFPHESWEYDAFKRQFLNGQFQQFFGFCIIFALSTLTKGIVEEKKRKIKEGMLMMGLKPWVFWASWVSTYFFIFLFVALSTTAASYIFVFRHSSFLLVFSFIFLFLLSVVTLALFLSTLFTDPGAASISAIFFYLACIFTPQALIGLSRPARMGFCLLSPMAFYWGFSVFGTYEGANQGVTFDNVSQAQEALSNSLKLQEVYLMLCLDTVLYLLMAWYFDKVIPGDFGAKQPFYFMFKPSYWCCGSSNASEGHEADHSLDASGAGRKLTARARGDVEEVSSSLTLAVKIQKLRKVFVSNSVVKVAVEEMNLDVYEGQVTALLGHNGAGKSTTFNMLTGLMRPTSGDASVYGVSVTKELDRVRLMLGVCPQHDVLWDQLTVLEHLELFAALKGVPEDQIRDESLQVISAVGLTEKREQFSCTLSGGMKRKLSIGIAVIGDSRVIFLDEPTSGMDPYSRRSSWEIIKNCKEGRVLLFTTHFMDEADLLGDRIAIMSAGRLRCCGTSLFLKERFGLGYNLTVSKRVGADRDDSEIRKLVLQFAPGALVLSDQGATLTFQVPFAHLSEFPQMFEALDDQKEELEIDSWGVSMTTLEEVFLKLAHMKHADDPAERERDSQAVRASRRSRETTDTNHAARRKTAELGERVAGVGSFSEHMIALFKKRLKCALRDRMNWVLQVIVPMLFLLVALVAITYGISETANPIHLGVNEYNSPLYVPYSGALLPESSAKVLEAGSDVDVQLVNVDKENPGSTFDCASYDSRDEETQAYPQSPAVLVVIDSFQGVDKTGTFTDAADWQVTDANRFVDRGCVAKAPGNEMNLSNYLIGTIDNHKTSRYGALMWANDTFSNDTLSKRYLVLHNDSAYHAIPTFFNLANRLILKAADPNSQASIKASIVPLSMTSSEHANNDSIKGLVLCFFLIIAFSIIPSTFVYAVVSEVSSKAKHQQMISGVNSTAYWLSAFLWDFLNYLIPAACAIALIAIFNVKAFLGDNTGCTVTVFVLYGASSVALTYVLSFRFKDQNNALLACISLYAVSGFVLFFVSFIMAIIPATMHIDKIMRYFYMCSPQYSFAMALFQIFTNHSSKVYSSAFDTEVAGKMIIYLSVSTGVFMILTLMLQHSSTSQAGCFSKLFHRSPQVPQDPEYVVDDDVEAEAKFLENPDNVDPSKTPIIVKKLRKVYHGRGNVKAKVAVRELSFHVPEGQVFGFLGINGAGKTSSLSMLSGEFPPTSGEALLNGMDMRNNRDEINRSMGYCPQFDALFDKLTGREHLQLYARIKGIPKDQEPMVVDHMIKTMDLTDHCEREAGGYSGGNKRKLSVAIALMGSPRIVFLDEPSTGMDPEARRFMWDVIATTMAGRSVILTTHSMEEAEALSHNIGIMVGGRLRCLGTTQHLKNKYGKGYSMELRASDERGDDIADWVRDQFPTAAVEERIGGQFKYAMPQQDVQLSSVFRALSDSKKALGLAAYTVSQTTLEQVFVKFAAEQEEETGSDAASIKASMRETYPDFVKLCLCRPKMGYNWHVAPTRVGGDALEIAVDFEKGACVCGSNPARVSINGELLEAFQMDDSNAPGCADAPCVGCREGFCGNSHAPCCSDKRHVFGVAGKTMEVVSYNEIPCSKGAHPCFLFVDGKEADTGIERNVFLEQVFKSAAQKWCCIVALPLFILMLLAGLTIPALFGLVFTWFLVVVACCVCANCCRAKHFARTAPTDDAFAVAIPPNSGEYIQASSVINNNPVPMPLHNAVYGGVAQQ